MGTVAVVMLDVLGKHGLEVAPPEDEKSVQTLASHRTHETFGNRVSPRCSNRRPNDPHPVGGQNAVKGGSELGVIVTD